MMRFALLLAIVATCTSPLVARPQPPVLLKPDRVFDGSNGDPHEGWVVLVQGEKIEPLLERKERLLLVVVGDCYDDFIEKFAGALDYVEMAVRDRIEAAWVNRAFHDWGKRSTFNVQRSTSNISIDNSRLPFAERCEKREIDPPAA